MLLHASMATGQLSDLGTAGAAIIASATRHQPQQQVPHSPGCRHLTQQTDVIMYVTLHRHRLCWGANKDSPVHHLSCLGLVVQDGLHTATGGHTLREHGDHNVHTEGLTRLEGRPGTRYTAQRSTAQKVSPSVTSMYTQKRSCTWSGGDKRNHVLTAQQERVFR
jgi:hypothetical protein